MYDHDPCDGVGSCTGCQYCTKTSRVRSYRWARKDHACGARKGDLLMIVRSKMFQVGGPILDYGRDAISVAMFGPAWGKGWVGLTNDQITPHSANKRWTHLAWMMDDRRAVYASAPRYVGVEYRNQINGASYYDQPLHDWLKRAEEFRRWHGPWAYKKETVETVIESVKHWQSELNNLMSDDVRRQNEIHAMKHCAIGNIFQWRGRYYVKNSHPIPKSGSTRGASDHDAEEKDHFYAYWCVMTTDITTGKSIMLEY